MKYLGFIEKEERSFHRWTESKKKKETFYECIACKSIGSSSVGEPMWWRYKSSIMCANYNLSTSSYDKDIDHNDKIYLCQASILNSELDLNVFICNNKSNYKKCSIHRLRQDDYPCAKSENGIHSWQRFKSNSLRGNKCSKCNIFISYNEPHNIPKQMLFK